jgi:hypothetical protein
MSWYQENKFAGTLLGITAVVSGALIYLGIGANSDATEAKEREQSAVTKINNLQSMKPFPSKENEELLVEDLEAFASEAKDFQNKLLAFRPEQMTKIRANEFSLEVSEYVKKLNKRFRTKGVEFPKTERPFYGMEAYRGKMAQDNIYLNYHRQALEWLFMTLAGSDIDSLDHIYRAPVAETMESKAVVATTGKRNTRNQRPQGITSVADTLPIEITFTASEASLQKFLLEVAAGEEYFFSVKMMKIRNAELDPVTISKSTFAPVVEAAAEEASEGVDGGLDLDTGFDFDKGGGAELSEDKEIIKQVIGDEKITVFLQLDLVLFKDAESVPIPRLKVNKTAKEPAVK